MAVVLKKIYQGVFWILNDVSDERTKNSWPASPIALLSIVGFYLTIVLHIGPKWMQNRKPYNLKNLMIVYNLLQIILNMVLVYEGFRHCWNDPSFNLFCHAIDHSTSPRATYYIDLILYFHLLKVVDLFDTVIFVFRKSYKQISFLHLYHHAGMILATWMGYRFIPGGHSIFVGLVNCPVHAIMFSYYLLTAIDRDWGKSIKLKRAITQLQLIQFSLFVLIYGAVVVSPTCNFPKILPYIFIGQNLFMACLFGDFYRKTYMRGNIVSKRA